MIKNSMAKTSQLRGRTRPRAISRLPRAFVFPIVKDMMDMVVSRLERRVLQIVVAVASLVPIAAGAFGVFDGPALVGNHDAGARDLDSHFRYLSGLLLAIGLAYAGAVPRIDRHRQRFLLLGGVVFVGGLGRLLSTVVAGTPSTPMIAALAMELLVTPLITAWQWRIAS
jgi:hypothetical protein